MKLSYDLALIDDSAYSTFRFGDGNLPVFIAYVDCKGTESSIANCTYSTESSSITRCLRYNDGRVGVQCRSSENIIMIAQILRILVCHAFL